MTRTFFTSIIAITAMMVTSACSDEPDFNHENPMLPDASYSPTILATMIQSSKNTTLTPKDQEIKLEKQGSKWRVDPNSGVPIDGGIPYAPTKIIFMNNKVYSPLVTFSSVCGPTRIGEMIYVLGTDGRIDKRREVIVSRDFSIDNSHMVINGKILYVTNIKNNVVSISVPHILPTDDISTAEKCSLFTFSPAEEDTEYYAFDSVEEVYAWALDLFRKRFGEETHFSIPGVIPDTPFMITTSDVENELAEWQQGFKDFIN